jgi:CRISPR-associated protein Csh1
VIDIINKCLHELDDNALDKIAIDTHKLNQGLYFKINSDYSLEFQVIEKKDNDTTRHLHDWFTVRDYYSSLLEMNKAIDTKNKKIHSNNPYAVFIKIDEFYRKDNFEETEQLFINLVQNFLISCEQKITSHNDSKIVCDYNYIENIYKNIIRGIYEHLNLQEIKGNQYVKMFIDKDETIYQKSYVDYIHTRLFNSSLYNVDVNGTTYGLSNDNMGMNSKKPYLALRSMKHKAPYLITYRQALISKLVFDWLGTLEYTDVYVNQNILCKEKN